MKFAASKWQIAAMVTLPAAIWFVAKNPDFPISKLPLAGTFNPTELIGQTIAVVKGWRS
jgi:hypothetical protein